jgi:hypothetical protein
MKKCVLHRYKVITLTLSLLFCLIQNPVNAAGSRPKISVNCGQIEGATGDNGTYGSFNPIVNVSYYGLPLNITAYYSQQPNTPLSETGQKITTVEGKSSSSKFYKDSFDFSYKFLDYGQKQTGFYQMYIVVTDNLKRKSKYTCTYKNYYFTFPIGSSNSKSDLFSYNKLCKLKGIDLFGKVQVVDYGADFRVQIVDYGADLNVKEVSYGAYSCGEWQIVDYGADFKVQLVSYGADFKVKLVSYGAGLN